MRLDAIPSAMSRLRTVSTRDSDRRRGVDGSSGVPGAYAVTAKLEPTGAPCANSRSASAEVGFRSDRPGPKVMRTPPSIGFMVSGASASTVAGGGGTAGRTGTTIGGGTTGKGGGAIGTTGGEGGGGGGSVGCVRDGAGGLAVAAAFGRGRTGCCAGGTDGVALGARG